MSESVCLCVILFPLQLIMYQTQTLAGGDRLSDIQSGYIQTSETYSLTTFRLGSHAFWLQSDYGDIE